MTFKQIVTSLNDLVINRPILGEFHNNILLDCYNASSIIDLIKRL